MQWFGSHSVTNSCVFGIIGEADKTADGAATGQPARQRARLLHLKYLEKSLQQIAAPGNKERGRSGITAHRKLNAKQTNKTATKQRWSRVGLIRKSQFC